MNERNDPIPSKRRRLFQRGVTLPELLAVVAIGGLAVAIGIPLIADQFKQAQLRSAADQFSVDLRAARMIAVSSRSVVSVQVEPDPSNAYQYADVNGKVRRIQLPKGLKIVSSTTPIAFHLNGSVPAAATTVIEGTLTAGATERWTITTSVLGVPKVVRQRIAS